MVGKKDSHRCGLRSALTVYWFGRRGFQSDLKPFAYSPQALPVHIPDPPTKPHTTPNPSNIPIPPQCLGGVEGGEGGGGSPMSILRNANVTCLCHLLFTMSCVEFKKSLCLMSLYFFLAHVPCHYY